MSQELKFHTEFKNLKINDVHKNDYNPNFVSTPMMNAIKDDIQKHGFIGHIVVQKKDGKGIKNVIINGEHRYEALRQLGAKEVPVISLDVPDNTAKLLTLRLNREHGELMPDKVAELLKDLDSGNDLDKLSSLTAMDNRELAILLNFSEDIGKQQLEALKPTNMQVPEYVYTPAPTMQADDETTIYLSWQSVEESVTMLANKLKTKYQTPNKHFAAIYAVPNGGLIPARLLARELDFYIQRAPHHGENILTSLPKKTIKPLLVVDDILDTGRTYDKLDNTLKDDQEFTTLISRKSDPVPFNVSYGRSLEGDKRWVRFPWEKINESRRKNLENIR